MENNYQFYSQLFYYTTIWSASVLTLLSIGLYYHQRLLLKKIQSMNKPEIKLFYFKSNFDAKVVNPDDPNTTKQIDFLINWNDLNTNNLVAQQKVIDKIEMKRRSFFRTCRNNVLVHLNQLNNVQIPFQKILSESNNDLIQARNKMDDTLAEDLYPAILTHDVDNCIRLLEQSYEYHKELSGCLMTVSVKKNEQEIESLLERGFYAHWIQFFNNPSLKLITASLKANGNNIIHLDDKKHEYWEIAIKSNPEVIKYLTSPENSLIELSIKTNPSSLQYIFNPTIDHCILALTLDSKVYKFVSVVNNPDPDTTLQNLLKQKYLLENL